AIKPLTLCGSRSARTPPPQLRTRLNLALVPELRLTRAQHLAHDLARNPQIPRDRLDRLPLNQMRAPDLRNRLHDQHSPLSVGCGSSPPVSTTRREGSLLDADPPDNGVLFARRFTHCREGEAGDPGRGRRAS